MAIIICLVKTVAAVNFGKKRLNSMIFNVKQARLLCNGLPITHVRPLHI